ncbi:Sec1 family domain-containing protein 1 [Trichoplax sp. H2]|nr:Sec1 family domain-containing protein 1 [Trichoplax sp. H2]|eukprot:RDD44878.1 Sec1 family domain-containing protein 1 [Trichoplax sp. H2]
MAVNELRRKQIESIKLMMNMYQPAGSKASSIEPNWKVLIYDGYGQDIISPLLTVGDLRDLGVTVHFFAMLFALWPLMSDREPIPDVPAIYLVVPSSENVDRIIQDCRNQLYDSYYLSFISPISRNRLEDLAMGTIHANSVSQISKVYDQYLNFICLEDDLFIPRYHDVEMLSYHALNSTDAKDTDIEVIRDILVDSLFSALATLGTVPIIRCPRGNAAEMVAEALDKKLRENLRNSRTCLFSGDSVVGGQFNFQRPLLIILDRNTDFTTILHHTWTYQALVHDLLNMELNRVNIQESSSSEEIGASSAKAQKPKCYDLNSDSDSFWSFHKGSPFPSVAEAIQVTLDEYRNSEDDIKKLKSTMGLEDESLAVVSAAVENSLSNDHTSKLSSAVSSLPELLEKKKSIDMHTNIATALLEHIKNRKLDSYFELEEKLMSKSSIGEISVMDILADPNSATPEDKLRLFLIYYICGPPLTDADLEKYTTTLRNAGVNLTSFDYVKKMKSFAKMTLKPSIASDSKSSVGQVFSRIMKTGSKFVMEGVKNLAFKTKDLPVTRIVDALMESRSIAEIEDYRYFDPKLLRASDGSAAHTKNPFQEAIVFMVGGGNYVEYQNLIDYAKRQTVQKHITYGCSELMTASHFLQQLERLG